MNSLTASLQILCIDHKRHYIPFWNFRNIYFTENPSITAYESSSRVLCNGLYNVILHVYRNSSINDIPSKKWHTTKAIHNQLFVHHHLPSHDFFNHDFNCRCLIYMFSLLFPGSKFLINLQWKFCACIIFLCR